MLNQLAQIYGTDHTDLEFVEAFKSGMCEEVIASIYVKYNVAFKGVCNKFIQVDSATKNSIVLEQIWNALMKYDPEKGAKLVTLICTYIKKKLMNYVRDMNRQRRDCRNTTVLSEFCYEEDREFDPGEIDNRLDDVIYRAAIEGMSHLTDKEKEYCICALDYRCNLSASAIAENINMSRQSGSHIRNELQNKLSFILK